MSTVSVLRAAFLRLANLFRKQKLDAELSAELESHLQFHVEDNLRAGMSPSEARRYAVLKLGGLSQTKEIYRGRLGLPFLQSILQDLRFTLRFLRKNLAFTFVVVLTLGLGIGANTAIFSIVESVLLKPLPFSNPDQLYTIRTKTRTHGEARAGVSMPEFEDYKNQSQSFEYIANFLPSFHYTWIGYGEPRVVRCTGISYDFFPALGIKPYMGRLYSPEEYHIDGVQVVISYRFWENELNKDPHILGRFLNFDNTGGMTVIGVMPPLPDWFPETDVWAKDVPDFEWARNRNNRVFSAVGRLRPGITRRQAEQELTTVLRRTPSESSEDSIELTPLKEAIVGNVRTGIETLMAAVVLVFLIAIANVAYLLSARTTRRQSEIALRLSIGAPRIRIVRQFLTENLLLAFIGGACGLILATGLVRLVARFNIGDLPRSQMIRTDSNVLLFAAAAVLFASLLLAWAPSATFSKLDLNAALRTGRAESGATAISRLRFLVLSEVSLAFVLVVGAGLLVRSFQAVSHVSLGFRPDHLMTGFFRTNYYSREGATFYNRVLERLAALPGARATAVSSCLPGTGISQATMLFSDRPNDPNRAPIVDECWISNDYFRAINARLLQGRPFDTRDDFNTQRVAIINREFARRYWLGQDPLGKRIAVNSYLASATTVSTPIFREIVGIVDDIKQRNVELPTEPTLYLPFLQDETNRVFVYMNLFVQSGEKPVVLGQTIQESVHSVEPDQPIEGLQPIDNVLFASLSLRRFILLLVGSFAALALILAAIGIYGMMAFFVSQRTREIGLRMAVGATFQDVLAHVMSQGLKLVAIGLLAGLLLALAVTRFMRGLLFGVGAADGVTMVAVPLLLLFVASLACYFPARTACKVDPMVALRYE